MNKKQVREEARKLRISGNSYNQIIEKLKINKSTLHYWVRDIILTEEQVRNLPKSNGQKGGDSYRRIWEKKRIDVQNSYDPPMIDNDFLIGLSIYWGEGSKYNASIVELTNADVVMVRCFVNWIRKYFEHFEFIVRIQHHYPERESCIIDYWSTELGISRESFMKSGLLMDNGGRKNRHLNGIAKVGIKGKGSWIIRQKIEKSLKLLKNKI